MVTYPLLICKCLSYFLSIAVILLSQRNYIILSFYSAWWIFPGKTCSFYFEELLHYLQSILFLSKFIIYYQEHTLSICLYRLGCFLLEFFSVDALFLRIAPFSGQVYHISLP